MNTLALLIIACALAGCAVVQPTIPPTTPVEWLPPPPPPVCPDRDFSVPPFPPILPNAYRATTHHSKLVCFDQLNFNSLTRRFRAVACDDCALRRRLRAELPSICDDEFKECQ